MDYYLLRKVRTCARVRVLACKSPRVELPVNVPQTPLSCETRLIAHVWNDNKNTHIKKVLKFLYL